MWVLATWNEMQITPDPTEQQIMDAVYAMDNKTRIGLSLYIAAPDSGGMDERIVMCGGSRLHVEYWPAHADEPSHALQDLNINAAETTMIDFGNQGSIEFPAWQTVAREVAIPPLLHFYHRRELSAGPWIRYEDL